MPKDGTSWCDNMDGVGNSSMGGRQRGPVYYPVADPCKMAPAVRILRWLLSR